MSTPNHYKVLQVDPEAEDEVIHAAYRRLARKYHPDVASDLEAAARMTAINAAWAVLRDPASRARYDVENRRLAASGQAPPAPPAAATPPRHDSTAPPRDRDPREVWGADRVPSANDAGGGMGGAAAGTFGEAGPPPGVASGSVLNFGRYSGWSLGQIGRFDPEFLEWLDRMPIGRPYRDEIDRLLRAAGLRGTGPANPSQRGANRRR
jgi:curved DNA-binding protein CbpA